MKLSLVVTQGAKEGTVIPVPVPQFLIGRDPQCQLRPASEAVSTRHCAILVRSGRVFVRDLKSRNGVFVNDQRIEGETELHHDDRLKVGPLQFKVQIVKAEASKKAPGRSGPVDDDSIADMLLDEAEAQKAAGPPSDKIAAMLLEIGDDAPATGPRDESGIPTGGTVTDMTLPADTTADASKDKKKVPSKADTASAAKAILEKMSRRGRG